MCFSCPVLCKIRPNYAQDLNKKKNDFISIFTFQVIWLCFSDVIEVFDPKQNMPVQCSQYNCNFSCNRYDSQCYTFDKLILLLEVILFENSSVTSCEITDRVVLPYDRSMKWDACFVCFHLQRRFNSFDNLQGWYRLCFFYFTNQKWTILYQTILLIVDSHYVFLLCSVDYYQWPECLCNGLATHGSPAHATLFFNESNLDPSCGIRLYKRAVLRCSFLILWIQ